MLKKYIKIILVVSFIVIIGCNNVFAVGWEFIGKLGWRCVDNNGEIVTNCIVENGDGLLFYADENGEKLIEHILEDYYGNTYYFNFFGAMAKNCWVCVDSSTVEHNMEPTPDYYYYYFGADGKAIKSANGRPRFFRIDGETYLFNEYGQLLTGWIDESGNVINELEEDAPFETALYYAGDDGALKTGWVSYENVYGSENRFLEDKSNLWLYFDKKNYKKRGYNSYVGGKINGKEYAFSDKGYIYTGFGAYESGASEEKNEPINYYGDKNDNGKYKAKWAYTIPPYDEELYTEDELSEKHWMYFEKSGKYLKNTVRKINSKYYAFDEKGIMQTGLVAFLDGTVLFIVDMDETSVEDIVKKGKYTYKKNGETYYFYDCLCKWYIGTIENSWFEYYAGNDDIWEEYDIREINFGTLDKEINTKRNFSNTGRKLDIGRGEEYEIKYNPDIKFYYFGDDGKRVNGVETVHFMDGEYNFGCSGAGHYRGMHNKKYYYDGIELYPDKDIGLGIYCVEDSYPQTRQKNAWFYRFAPLSYKDDGTINEYIPDEYYERYYIKLNENESLYKVMNKSGRLLPGRNSAYKDGNGNFWYVTKNGGWLYGIFTTNVKKGKISNITINKIMDKNTCPDVFVNGTKQEMIDYFYTFDELVWKYAAEVYFGDAFKDYYTFMKSGKITNVSLKNIKDSENEFMISITYEGMLFRAAYNDRNTWVPFGMADDGGRTATFFVISNDYAFIPDSNDYFVNCCWDDTDAVDFLIQYADENGDVIDFYTR